MDGHMRSVPVAPSSTPSVSAPPSTLKYESANVHPVASALATSAAADLKARRTLQAATFGSTFPMRRMMTESVLSQFHRLPGLPSSGIALERLSGRDTDIGFEDYLNLPSDNPEAPGGGWDTMGQTHEAMERALGIAPKAPF